MHKMSLCEEVLQVLKDNARTQGYRRVKTVWLEIGGDRMTVKEMGVE